MNLQRFSLLESDENFGFSLRVVHVPLYARAIMREMNVTLAKL